MYRGWRSTQLDAGVVRCVRTTPKGRVSPWEHRNVPRVTGFLSRYGIRRRTKSAPFRHYARVQAEQSPSAAVWGPNATRAAGAGTLPAPSAHPMARCQSLAARPCSHFGQLPTLGLATLHTPTCGCTDQPTHISPPLWAFQADTHQPTPKFGGLRPRLRGSLCSTPS